MAGIFGELFSGLRFPRIEARKVLKKFGENSEQNSGGKFEELSICDFSDLTLFGHPPFSGTLSSGMKKAHKLLTHKLFENSVNPATSSQLTQGNAYFLEFGGEHINFFVRLTGRLSRGQFDPHQSKKFMFMCLFLFLS